MHPRCEAFLGSMGSLTSPCGSASGLGLHGGRICLPPGLRPYPGTTTARYSYPPASPHQLAYYPIGPRGHRLTPKGSADHALSITDSAWTATRGYGNINPLSIDYACRPRLRSRLTLGGLACPRNPWSSGGGVSHSSFATHACILTRDASTAGFPRRFTRDTTLPYPSALSANATASAACLSPVTLSARNHLTSELLRTLSRVAASKPTSWLSVQLHILSHLACA
jgi:hypothetical protein